MTKPDPPKIEKGIPIPPKRNSHRLMEMEIGDSVLLQIAQKASGSAISYATEKMGYKYTTRQVEGGTRIWRIA